MVGTALARRSGTVAKRVLIVEDETILRKHLARLLARYGYEVATAGTRAEALDELAHGTFEAIVVDVRLPDGDGLEFLAGLGEERRPPHAMVMTASTSDDNEERAEQLRVSRFVRKPIDIEQFIGAVRTQLPPELDRDPQTP
jgi:two-component system response regulator AtoC